jgi:hypothetical protein
MIQESSYLVFFMCLAPVLTFCIGAGLLTILRNIDWN